MRYNQSKSRGLISTKISFNAFGNAFQLLISFLSVSKHLGNTSVFLLLLYVPFLSLYSKCFLHYFEKALAFFGRKAFQNFFHIFRQIFISLHLFFFSFFFFIFYYLIFRKPFIDFFAVSDNFLNSLVIYGCFRSFSLISSSSLGNAMSYKPKKILMKLSKDLLGSLKCYTFSHFSYILFQ